MSVSCCDSGVYNCGVSVELIFVYNCGVSVEVTVVYNCEVSVVDDSCV